jgi:serine protease Do
MTGTMLARVVTVGLVLAGPALGQKDSATPEDLKVARSLSRAFNHAAEAIAPSVVHVTQLGTVYYRENFFGPLEKREGVPKGAGSGVIVSKDGYVLTNNHVVEGAEQVKVKLLDQRELEGKVVGVDPATDLAVIKVDAKDLTAAKFGDSEALDVGEWVIAVGSPFGQFDNSVTAGIVSAKGRTGLASASDESNEDYIQTDAAINPGNSGGPLVNLDGQVVGINSQIATRSGGYQGIGFSIPASIVRAVMEQLIATGRVDRGGIGITMAPLTPKNAKQIGYKGTDGVIVNQVAPESPADKAGLRAGDVVVHFNGKAVNSVNRLANFIAFTPPGTTAVLDVVRAGSGMKIDVPVAERDEIVEGNRANQRYGFTVRTAPQQYQQRYGRRGVVVASVEQAGPAATVQPTALEEGDFIVSVNGISTPVASAFDTAVAKVGNTRLRLNVIRGMETGYIDVPPRK